MAAPGNVLKLYDDRPTDFEAWDLDPFHLETRADCPPAASAEVVLADPLRVEVAFERPIGERSRMRQTVRLDAEAQRLEFHCAIDWQEDRKALKVRFPVAVLAPRATYEMQFGVVERPTHFPPAPTPPSTRCPAIASRTSPSTVSGSRCCRRRPTAGRRSAARCG